MFRDQKRLIISSQRGSALIIALFVIVVMAMLAAGISKNISASTEQTIYEVLGTRALFAAESGNELMLAKAFPVSGTSLSCDPAIQQQLYLNAEGLNQCAALMRCSSQVEGGISFYQIVTTGVCKANMVGNNSAVNNNDFVCLATDPHCASRTIEVEAKSL